MERVCGPLARGEGLLVEPIGDELLVFDQERNRAHSLNSTAAAVWRACDGQRDVDALAAECGVDRETVRLALDRLRGVHLLADDGLPVVMVPGEGEGVSRRAMLRKSVLAGAGVGLAIPVIRSITAPSIAMAASNGRVKGKAGQPCTSNGQCSPSSFCPTSWSVNSCQRKRGASCSQMSSCFHTSSRTSLCQSGVCGPCSIANQCPGYAGCAGGWCIR